MELSDPQESNEASKRHLMSQPGQDTERLVGACFYGAATVGERGQVVIPAEARRATDISPGDKLLVFRHPFGDGVMLVKLDAVHRTMARLKELLEEVEVRQAEDVNPEGETQ